jgi:ATP-dependent DNA helicase RecQ
MPEGSTCIAARTNAEALNIAGYLIKKGITARLIQTNSDFSLHNLAEIRDFTDYLERESEGHSIDDEVWQNALSLIKRKYTSSSDIQSVFRLLGDFSEICGMTKYKSDLNQYIRESKLEDFISSRNSAILVSTIHQTKGREFDNMFLALSGITSQDDETKRAIYVALTRAKKNLYIYCNSGYFDRINTDSIIRCTDNTNYPEPAVISMQLSHRDVALGYFSYKRREIDKLVSGQELNLTDAGCFAGEKQVLKFSSSFKRKIDELSIKGYIPVKAVIRHIVFWQDKDKDKDKNKDKESKIILPDLEFAKMDQE